MIGRQDNSRVGGRMLHRIWRTAFQQMNLAGMLRSESKTEERVCSTTAAPIATVNHFGASSRSPLLSCFLRRPVAPAVAQEERFIASE
jgi:hypothetical protein